MSREWLKYKKNCFMIRKKKWGKQNVNSVKVRELVIGEGMPKICVPIVGRTNDEILQAAREVCNSSADLVEWRVDWYESVFDIEKVKMLAGELREILEDMPLLFTFRTKNEGGEKEISYEQYKELLLQVASTSFVDVVDVEVFIQEDVKAFVASLKKKGVKVVGSNHDFAKTPDKDEIIRRLCYMQEVGVDIPKIAVMPRSPKDVITLLSATEEMVSEHADRPIVTMSMAGTGAVSRIAGETFGSAITFGAMQKASAPGQINVEELKKMLKILHQD